MIMGVVVDLTFLFRFGNVLNLALGLGVPVWVAPSSRQMSTSRSSASWAFGNSPWPGRYRRDRGQPPTADLRQRGEQSAQGEMADHTAARRRYSSSSPYSLASVSATCSSSSGSACAYSRSVVLTSRCRSRLEACNSLPSATR